MKWEEVRRIYPNKFVKIQILEFHFEGNIKIIDEMALIKEINDNKTATRELFSCDEGTLVYHTAKDNIYVEVVQRPYFNKFKYRRCCDNND
jgi:hypothetical protein